MSGTAVDATAGYRVRVYAFIAAGNVSSGSIHSNPPQRYTCHSTIDPIPEGHAVSRHDSPDNDIYTPPPPSSESPGWVVGVVSVVGLALTLLVLLALQQSARIAIEVGTALVILGLLLGIGLIARAYAVRLAAAAGLITGGIITIYLGADRGDILWIAGGVIFFLCAILVMIRDRFIPERR